MKHATSWTWRRRHIQLVCQVDSGRKMLMCAEHPVRTSLCSLMDVITWRFYVWEGRFSENYVQHPATSRISCAPHGKKQLVIFKHKTILISTGIFWNTRLKIHSYHYNKILAESARDESVTLFAKKTAWFNKTATDTEGTHICLFLRHSLSYWSTACSYVPQYPARTRRHCKENKNTQLSHTFTRSVLSNRVGPRICLSY